MSATDNSHGAEPTRRDFIHILALATTAVGAAGAVVPLVQQMNPDASVLALSTKEVDLSSLEVGQAIKVMWQGKPVFIRRRTAEEIETSEDTPLSDLKDPIARNDNIAANADAEDKNRVINPQYIVVVGVCTHLGCVPLGTSPGEVRGDYGGWFCPCHGSHYDNSGRIRKGPAPQNLEVPKYVFVTDSSIRVG
ncbi:MAG: ubiquinol-cytochrome c reductase iron-sulfur subunit [Alphaproteobacteria bacterium RIFCSPHIGHO2_12_FULL_63_12]|nr:MAG: ubiquinol-cytochrome c reductase iron-sulfur subunit [Alphaproteobacteria bacterium RIFCSPHIGHO2_12_FULL_63_12]